MSRINEFGKQIKHALTDRDLTQKWLIEEVRKKTDLYFDSSYLNKIMTGKSENDKVVTAIKEILDIA